MYRVEMQEDGSYLIVNNEDPTETYVWQPGVNLPDHVMQALIGYLGGQPEQVGPGEVPVEGADPFGQTSQGGGRPAKPDAWYNLTFKNQLGGGGGSSGWGGFRDPYDGYGTAGAYLAAYNQAAAQGVPLEPVSTLEDLTPEEQEIMEREQAIEAERDIYRSGTSAMKPSSGAFGPTEKQPQAGTMDMIRYINSRMGM